ncbi:DUF3368 domain-containing protein [Agarilytica rhodophyticola]|uniref:DUF3368 domain-containing protein n=1 Tax=Agarilytica rhodophyticola TaxID=1737490 RepID=UPI000B3449CF|nr:DUF3368 domain-containing protein [Agarilytica rhodophyticola]
MVNKPGKIVVSDTTAITYLSQIGAIELLKNLFKTIYIPEAVYQELTRQGDHIGGSKEVKTLPWIKVKKVNSYDGYAKKFKKKLDPGESQAIGLALHTNADLLIIDELDGRWEAKNQGIRVAGMLGIFKMAKERGIIPAVAPYLNKLRLTSFKLSPILYNTVLQDLGEVPKTSKA